MRNFIKATVTRTIDTGRVRVRVVATGNDKLRAFALLPHLCHRHVDQLPAGYWSATSALQLTARAAIACWVERISSAMTGMPARRQPVCIVPCSSVATG